MAGTFVVIDYWTIGRMTPQGYVMGCSVRQPIDSGKEYQIELVLGGQLEAVKVHVRQGGLSRGGMAASAKTEFRCNKQKRAPPFSA